MDIERRSTLTPQEMVQELQARMASRGMTVTQLADLLRMPKKSVEPWFRSGKSHYLPSMPTVRKIVLELEREEEGPPSINLDLFSGRTPESESQRRQEVQSLTASYPSSNTFTRNGNSSTKITSLIENSQHFQDEVYGEIFLSQLEQDLIDTPEFQRLFRISQLGFIDLVYQSANHNRGQHSIGVCESAKQLIEHLNKNSRENAEKLLERLVRTGETTDHQPLPPLISPSEEVLIRLGALLHDIPHAPFSHDIEKKTHYVYKAEINETPVKSTSYYGGYEKHDDLGANPTFYIAVFDSTVSVLARVLKHYSPSFWELLSLDAKDDRYKDHLEPFVQAVEKSDWGDVDAEILQALLFHLMAFEHPSDGIVGWCLEVADHWGSGKTAHTKEWGLGPNLDYWKELHRKWYQPFRHDIVGNTLSADLIDYLQRDLKRLGINRGIDLNLLNHYVLAPITDTFKHDAGPSNANPSGTLFRCAIDLNDYKRGTIREYLLNDVFRLLDLRHEIHEKAVNHRVVHAAVGMLSRALLQLDKDHKKPLLKEIVGADGDCAANYGEESFLGSLIDLTSGKAGSMQKLNSLPQKIAERRIYRPLMIIPGDVALSRMLGLDAVKLNEVPLRKLAAIVDSELFSPFFLFLSQVIQDYLQHGYEKDEILWEYIMKIATLDRRDEMVKRAMNFVPKRVIVSATPYKQLYKDPALVVRVDTTVKQIDELGALERRPEIATRVSAAMEDAEQKYAGMWKLFVFISDGLYYTGTIAKLFPGHRCGMDIDAHVKCLQFAQRFLITGFKVAYEDWSEKQKTIKPPTLDAKLQEIEFQRLLLMFWAKKPIGTELPDRIQREVSGINLEWYLHGNDTDHCKDVRYKFDQPSTLDLEELARGPDKGRAEAAKALRAFGLAKGRLLERETLEFLEKHESATDELKATISREVEGVEEEQLVRADRNPVPTQPLIAAIHELYRGDPPGA